MVKNSLTAAFHFPLGYTKINAEVMETTWCCTLLFKGQIGSGIVHKFLVLCTRYVDLLQVKRELFIGNILALIRV